MNTQLGNTIWKTTLLWAVVLTAVFTSGCTPIGQAVDSSEYTLPDGLKDCKMYYLRGRSGQNVYVLRCPSGSTHTTLMGKAPTNGVVETSDINNTGGSNY